VAVRVTTAFQSWLMLVPAGRSNSTRQAGIALAPSLVTVIRPTYPEDHLLS
jgi:hypothetical protein